MKITALIMAGGKGERFWPRSREKFPKQFIDITGCGKTMLQLTAERVLSMVGEENIFVVTNMDYKQIVAKQLPYIPNENILCEPVGRNTAPCIGLGAAYMLKKGEDVVMIVLASDHLIRQEEKFRSDLKKAVDVAECGENLVTIGIKPNRPETNYGYIKKGSSAENSGIATVKQFEEKPDLQKAIEYINSGDYLWNSGIFIWKASTIMKLFQQYIPDIYQHIRKISYSIGTECEKEILEKEFVRMRSVSVDYGIMEHAANVYVVPGDFEWDDVGSWLALERINEQDVERNIIHGNVITAGTHNCIIESGKKLIAAVNLSNMIIVDTEDIILIADKESVTDIKKIRDKIQADNLQDKYL